ncbi:MAG: RraA family protein [Terricaulis sp.]|nr:RraA family protein [Terricaulis sp.]
MINADEIAQARKFGAATLHEAAGRIGALPGALQAIDPSFGVAGRAFTIHGPGGDNLWIHRALYLAQPGDILVVCTSGGHEFGYWGEILNEAAIARGLGGLVIDGGVRDVAALRRASFPVFARGHCIRGTGKDHGAIAWLNKPIQIGDVVIASGDLIVGDVDGVVAIPPRTLRACLSVLKRAKTMRSKRSKKFAPARERLIFTTLALAPCVKEGACARIVQPEFRPCVLPNAVARANM